MTPGACDVAARARVSRTVAGWPAHPIGVGGNDEGVRVMAHLRARPAQAHLPGDNGAASLKDGDRRQRRRDLALVPAAVRLAVTHAVPYAVAREVHAYRRSACGRGEAKVGRGPARGGLRVGGVWWAP